MKLSLASLLMVIGLSNILLFAETNNTKTQPNKQESVYEDKLKEALGKLESDLKKNKIDNNMTIARDYNAVGFYYNKTKQTKQALKYYLKATKIVETQKKSYSKQKTIYYNNTATAYDQLKQFSDALKYYEKALAIYKENLPADHPYIAGTTADIGNVYAKMDDKEKALQYHLTAYKIRKKSLRPSNHPDTFYSCMRVAALLDETNNPKESIKYYNEVMDLLNLDDNQSKKNVQEKIDTLKKKIKLKK